MRNFFGAELADPNVKIRERKERKKKPRIVITTTFKSKEGDYINILYHLELKLLENIL